ncbi:transketolase family protein [bacterium]|nr:MAG: transketolase family protein [bacterium]
MDGIENKKLELRSLRDGFGEAVFNLAKSNRNVFVLSADLSPSLRIESVRKELPDQFVECGVAEQNIVGIAAGLAISGKIPFVASFAEFLTGRAWEQIRIDVCYNNVNVKLIGSHAGLATGEDGATHQMLEDLALMRVLPNMTVVAPCDANEAYQATIAASKINGPVYIRLARPETPIITDKNTPFEIGKINIVKQGKDIVIFATGLSVYEALLAAETLKEQGKSVAVLNVHTIKPLDKETIKKFVKDAKLVITVEDHQIIGGLGSAISEVLTDNNINVPLKRLGVNNSFGESGKYKELWEKYGIDKEGILKAIGG